MFRTSGEEDGNRMSSFLQISDDDDDERDLSISTPWFTYCFSS